MNQRLQVLTYRDWRTLVLVCWANSILCDNTNRNWGLFIDFQVNKWKSGLNGNKIVLSLPKFLFYLYVALHFLSSNEGIKNLIICATRSLRSRAPLAKTLQQAISKNYFLHTNVLSYLWTMVDLTQTSPCTEAVQYGLPEKHDRTRGRLRKQLHYLYSSTVVIGVCIRWYSLQYEQEEVLHRGWVQKKSVLNFFHEEMNLKIIFPIFLYSVTLQYTLSTPYTILRAFSEYVPLSRVIWSHQLTLTTILNSKYKN